MTFSEAFDYLKEKGCTFTYDNPGAITFSTVHVHYDGTEFGTMDLHNMTFYTDRSHQWLHQFNYRTMWLSDTGNDAAFKKLVDSYIAGKSKDAK